MPPPSEPHRAALTPPSSSPAGVRTIPNGERHFRFIQPGDTLRCPLGHRMKQEHLVLEHGGIRCTHQLSGVERRDVGAPLHARCGVFFWLLLLPYGLRFVAEVTEDELRHMQTVHMNPGQALVFLGVDGPVVSARPPR